MKQIDVAEADRADSVAMIRALQGKKLRTLQPARTSCELVGELERDLHCGGTVVGEEHLVQTRSAGCRARSFANDGRLLVRGFLIGKLDELFGKQSRRLIRDPERRTVGDLL